MPETVASPGYPPDPECIDYLFFVHDRHAGNREAIRQYLAWETGLLDQLDAEDLWEFRRGPFRNSTLRIDGGQRT